MASDLFSMGVTDENPEVAPAKKKKYFDPNQGLISGMSNASAVGMGAGIASSFVPGVTGENDKSQGLKTGTKLGLGITTALGGADFGIATAAGAALGGTYDLMNAGAIDKRQAAEKKLASAYSQKALDDSNAYKIAGGAGYMQDTTTTGFKKGGKVVSLYDMGGPVVDASPMPSLPVASKFNVNDTNFYKNLDQTENPALARDNAFKTLTSETDRTAFNSNYASNYSGTHLDKTWVGYGAQPQASALPVSTPPSPAKRQYSYIEKDGRYFQQLSGEDSLRPITKLTYDFGTGAAKRTPAPSFAKGGSIHINPANEGLFTSEAQANNMGVQEFASHVLSNKEQYSSEVVRRANFAHNSISFNHEQGGIIKGKDSKNGKLMTADKGDFIVDGNHVDEFLKETGMPAKQAPLNNGSVPIRAGENGKDEYLVKEHEAQTLYDMGVDLNKYAPDADKKWKDGKIKGYLKGNEVKGNYEEDSPEVKKAKNDAFLNQGEAAMIQNPGILPVTDFDENYRANAMGGGFQQGLGMIQPSRVDVTPVSLTDGKDYFAATPAEQKKGLSFSDIYYGASAATAVGTGLYNLMQEYTPGAKPIAYKPEQYVRDFEGERNAAENEISKAGRTNRYNARNLNRTDNANAAIHANELDARVALSTKLYEAKAGQEVSNLQERNKAQVYNNQAQNEYANNEANRRLTFRDAKGKAVISSIRDLLSVGKDYLNEKNKTAYSQDIIDADAAVKYGMAIQDNDKRAMFSRMSKEEQVKYYRENKTKQ